MACISYVDACVGRLLDALERSGHADHTIVVFMGDYGYQMREYNSWGHKHSNFEISTRTPLLIAAPKRKAMGQSTSRIVEFLDLYPTLCELARLPQPSHLEGTSFARLLDDPLDKRPELACSVGWLLGWLLGQAELGDWWEKDSLQLPWTKNLTQTDKTNVSKLPKGASSWRNTLHKEDFP